MIELSTELQGVQQQCLLGKSLFGKSSSSGSNSTSVDDGITPSGLYGVTAEGVKVTWFPLMREVPKTEPLLCIGQEFLDAFPVHQFVYTSKGWRERLVDIDVSKNSPNHFRFVISANVTPAVMSILRPTSSHTSRKKVSSDKLPIVSGGKCRFDREDSSKRESKFGNNFL
jgi:hypothetical protein